jgi:hypothetical protein
MRSVLSTFPDDELKGFCEHCEADELLILEGNEFTPACSLDTVSRWKVRIDNELRDRVVKSEVEAA